MDEGTRMLLEALEVRVSDVALDIGCGAGFIGASIARRATKGQVTMVDASFAAVEAARRLIEQDGLSNVQVLPGDGAQELLEQRFDLVVTNPPFHIGGIQTTEIAERFIREAAQVLRLRGRFYLVANRFLKSTSRAVVLGEPKDPASVEHRGGQGGHAHWRGARQQPTPEAHSCSGERGPVCSGVVLLERVAPRRERCG